MMTGGEESIRYLGYYFGIIPMGNILYVPSYPPLYGKAEGIYHFIKEKNLEDMPISFPLCITLHWSWEVEQGFKNVRKLATFMAKRIANWEKLVEC